MKLREISAWPLQRLQLKSSSSLSLSPVGDKWQFYLAVDVLFEVGLMDEPLEVRPADKGTQSSCLPIPAAGVSVLLVTQLLNHCWLLVECFKAD